MAAEKKAENAEMQAAKAMAGKVSSPHLHFRADLKLILSILTSS
jgi:hypothetical protein